METYLSDQAIAFLWAVVLGAALGVVYDWFRIGRILRRKWWLTVFLEDLAFSLIAAAATAFCFSLTNHGQVRAFLLAGEALGFILYFNTFGVFVAWQARLLARFFWWIRIRLEQLRRWLLQHLQKFINFLKKHFLFLWRWCKMIPYHSKRRKSRLDNEGDRKSE